MKKNESDSNKESLSPFDQHLVDISKRAYSEFGNIKQAVKLTIDYTFNTYKVKVGDQMVINNSNSFNGEYTLPDGSTAMFKDGVVTNVQRSYYDQFYSFQKRRRIIKNKNGTVLTIYSENKDLVFSIGNHVTVNGKKNLTGKSTFKRFTIHYADGLITKIK